MTAIAGGPPFPRLHTNRHTHSDSQTEYLVCNRILRNLKAQKHSHGAYCHHDGNNSLTIHMLQSSSYTPLMLLCMCLCNTGLELQNVSQLGFKSCWVFLREGKVRTLRLGDHLSAAASSWVHLAGHAAGSGQGLFGTYTACIMRSDRCGWNTEKTNKHKNSPNTNSHKLGSWMKQRTYEAVWPRRSYDS